MGSTLMSVLRWDGPGMFFSRTVSHLRCLHDTRSEGEEPKAELVNAGVEGEARDHATDAILPGNSAQTSPGSGSFGRYNKYVERMILIIA